MPSRFSNTPYETMRRPTKASSVTKHSSNLDLMPSNDDDAGTGIGIVGSKVHNKRKSTSMSTLAITIFCGLVALGTLFYVSNKVLSKSRSKVGDINSMASNPPTYTTDTDRLLLPKQNIHLPPDSIYRTEVQDIHGDWKQLMDYSGGISLIINVACE